MLARRATAPVGAAQRRPFVASRLPLSTPRQGQAVRRGDSTRVRGIVIDWSDPDAQIAVAGIAFGLLFGVGAPYFYIKRTEQDEIRLEELRALNRANFEQKGEYLTEDEIAQFRKPKWTDRREWADDD